MIETILKDNWTDYKTDPHPIDRRMRILEEKGVRGMSTENIRFLFNEIVKKYKVYLEVGMWRGCSLLSAALFNSARCIGIDNFSEFNYDSAGKFDENPEEELKSNLNKFSCENIEWYRGDYKEVIRVLSPKVDVYFYDGNHSYENQLEGLRIILPYLSEKSVVIVDDLNWEQVERANNDFIKENPDFKSVLKIKTEDNGSRDWWNGIEIIEYAKSESN